jgi:hypothetical protein
MPIPSALQKQREILKAAAAVSQTTDATNTGETTPPAAVAAPALTVVPTVTPTSQPDNPVAQLSALETQLQNAVTPEALAEVKREIADMTAKYSTMSGRVSAESKRAAEAEARIQQLDLNARAFEQRAAEAERQRDELSAVARERERNAQLQGLDDSNDMSDEEINSISPEDAKMIKSLTKKQFVPLLKTLYAEVDEMKTKMRILEDVGARVSEIGKTQADIDKHTRATAARMYFRKELTPHVADWEQVVGSEAWKEYMKTPDDPTRPDFKKGHMVHRLQESKNIPGLVAVVKEFKMSQAPGGSALAQLVTPAATSAAAATPVPVQMKTSEYVDNQRKFNRTKEMKPADWEAYKSKFRAALEKGQVVDDAKIL